MATHNTKGSSGNTVENAGDEDLELFLLSVEVMLQLYSSEKSYN